MLSSLKMDAAENDSIRKPKTYVETNRKFKRLTLINNNTPEANKKALDEYLGRASRKNEEAEWKTIKPQEKKHD